MSLGKTLLKVVIGVAIAKGVQAVTQGSGASPAPKPSTKTAGRGTRYDGGLEDMMGDVLGTNRGRSGGRAEENGDLLEQITGKRRTSTRSNAPKGGLSDVLEQMTNARTGRGGANAGSSEGGLGDLLGSILGGASATARRTPEQDQEISAALMLRAVITAVKADGDLDADEKQRLMDSMGDASAAEVKAVNAELSRPVDVDALVRIVPQGMEAQVYMVSLNAINLDHKAEAQYLHTLAEGLELTKDEINALHDRAGAPRLYR